MRELLFDHETSQWLCDRVKNGILAFIAKMSSPVSGLNSKLTRCGKVRLLIWSSFILTCLICGTVILGWSLDVSILKNWVPGWPTMKCLSAVGMLITGCSLFSSVASRWPELRPWRRFLGLVSIFCACVPILLGVTLIILGLPQSQEYFGESVNILQGWLGQPAPATALTMVFFGAALLKIRNPRRSWFFCFCVGCASAFSWLALLRLIYGNEQNEQNLFFGTVSLPTVLSCLTISMGIMVGGARSSCVRYISSSHASGRLLRQLLPISVFLAFFLGLVQLWGQNRWGFSKEFGAAFYSTVTTIILVSIILRNAQVTERLERLRVKREKQINRNLEDRERRFRGIFNSTFQFIGLLSPDGVILEANQSALALIGAEASEVLGRYFWECPWWAHSLDEQDKLRVGIASAAQGESVRFYTWHPDEKGGRREVDFSIKPVQDNRGNVIFLVPEGRDITEIVEEQRLQLEKERSYQEQIKLNQKRLEEAQRMAHIGHWEWDLTSGEVEWSEELFRLFGLAPGSKPPSYQEQEKMFTKDSWERLAEISQVAVLKGVGYSLDLEIEPSSGERRRFIASAEPVRDSGGKVVRFFGTTQDITSQHEAHQKMEQISQRLKLATQAASIGIWDWDIIQNQLFWDDLMHEIYAQPKEQNHALFEVWKSRLHPDDRDNTLIVLNEALEGLRDFNATFRIVWPDGSHHYIQANAIVQRDEGGKPVRMLGTNADVTKQVMSEARLLESEERFRHAFEYSAVGLALLEPNGTWMAVNKAVCDIVGYTEAELLKLTFQDITHPDDLEKDLDNVNELIRGESTHYQMEKRYLHKNGHVVWILLTASLVKEDDGSPAYFISQIEDITQRHEAERVLKHQQEQLRMLIEHTPAAVAMFDMEMKYMAASQRWVEDYHLQSQFLIGRSHYEIFPEIGDDWKAIHRRCLGGALESRDEDMFIRQDGNEEWLRWAVRPWLNVSGEIGGIVMFTEVITERKLAAERIHASLEEKEVLLREIHHRVKNNMQIISSLLQLQTSALHDPADVAIFKDCQTRIHAMAMVHDRLYRSGNLSTINFGDHLSELAGLLSRGQSSNTKRISIKTNCEAVELELDKAIPLGLIATELITNAFKHGFYDREEGTIHIDLKKKNDKEMILRVSDDGQGMPAGTDPISSRTLGLRLVRSLSHQLRAKILFSSEGRGCCAEVTFVV